MRSGRASTAAVADGVFDTLVGFSGFGFPKAHAAAFGLLAYQSAWLRHHYPAEFLCGLLNEQPMGFYPPASLVRDAQRRGVEVRPPDVNLSGARCGLEPRDDVARRMRSASGSRTSRRSGPTTPRRSRPSGRRNGPFRDVGDLARRATVSRDALEALVRGAPATASGRAPRSPLGARPRDAAALGGGDARRGEAAPAPARPHGGDARTLPDLTRWERMLADYRETSALGRARIR